MKGKIAVIGLGYVGLPLAIEFGKKRDVIGFDTNKERINSLKNGIDITREVSKKDLKTAKKIKFSSNTSLLEKCNIFIVTVPTPIDRNKNPDLSFIKSACKMIGQILKKNNLVIFESTVYPGCTEEDLVPILESKSGLKLNKDFLCGYSPERINPSDKLHTLTKIKKITSGSNSRALKIVDNLYKEIISAGTVKTSSIRIAEAAKIIENTQRDINIALMNELAKIFNILKLDTAEVIQAANTKWNFLPFKPGLVGGHCIGVDPYYLTYKAKKVGYKPKIILSGRNLNDSMSSYISKKFIERLKSKKINLKKAKILILGLTFKENCRDLRNSKVVDLVNNLRQKLNKVEVYDPNVDKKEALDLYKIKLLKKLRKNFYDGVILAVTHDQFKSLGLSNIRKTCKKNFVFYDVKHMFDISESDMRL